MERVRGWQSTPDRPAESLDSGYAQYLLATDAQLIDVRSPAEFAHGALPGAMNLPVEALSYGYGYYRLNRRHPVILCGANEFRSRRAAHLLAGRGFSRIYYLADLDFAG
jgi:rhodanese-related sulfurtransferase